MSSQPLHISAHQAFRPMASNHLSLGSDIWSFSPLLIAKLAAQINLQLKHMQQNIHFFVRSKLAYGARQKLSKSIGSDTTIVFLGNRDSGLAMQVQVVATNKQRKLFQSDDQSEIPFNAFTFYGELPQNMLARYISNQAVFELDPARPDLILRLMNCLQRDSSRQFALSNHWSEACEAKDWFPASKLKLQLANLHKPAYLLLRTRTPNL